MVKLKQRKKLKDEVLRDRQLQMCVWFAEMKSTSEITALVKEHYGVKLSRQSIWLFSKAQKWNRVIQFLRRKLFSNILSIPIANKSIRLNYLQNVYKEAMTESLKSINQWGEIYELKLGAAIEAVKAAREEVEKLGIDKDDPIIDEEIEVIFGNGNGHQIKNRIAKFINQ